MPRKFKGGKKKSRCKNKLNINRGPLIVKDKSVNGSQLYGIVNKRLGGKPPYVSVICEDCVTRVCVIRGKFIKTVWINVDDVVLINYNKNNDNLKGEIETKYSVDNISKLKRMGELKYLLDNKKDDDEEDNIQFTNNDVIEKKEKEEKLDFNNI